MYNYLILCSKHRKHYSFFIIYYFCRVGALNWMSARDEQMKEGKWEMFS